MDRMLDVNLLFLVRVLTFRSCGEKQKESLSELFSESITLLIKDNITQPILWIILINCRFVTRTNTKKKRKKKHDCNRKPYGH